jgi:predicted CXXCH cytochrome family protein
MKRSHVHVLTALALATSALALTGCVDEKIVYRDGASFAAPTTAAANFVGYSDEANKKTVCGSCHSEVQARWVKTKHASAWKDLQASGAAASYCEACHTVGPNGNAADAGGYSGDKNARYHDVQCESCHGAGLTHISGPNASNRPLASIKADTGLKNGCGECHSGTHNPFVDEWRISGHSKTWEASHNSTDPYCQSCHTGNGFILTQAGSNENYVEKGATTPMDAVCATCHDPHGSPNKAQLRFPINTASTENNLCMKCHQRRGTLQDASAQGRNSGHSPEGPTLLGQAGWFPPGMAASDSIRSSHGDAGKNPNLCATCHVSKYQGTDPITKAATFSTGHRFLATPCVGANGLPTVDQTCTTASMRFTSCLGTGCHATEALARSANNTALARVTLLSNEATRLINLVKAGPKAAECTFATTKAYTTCMGIQFNQSLVTKAGGIIHNPFLLEQLMVASINQMKKDYGVVVAADVDLTLQLQKSAKSLVGGK